MNRALDATGKPRPRASDSVSDVARSCNPFRAQSDEGIFIHASRRVHGDPSNLRP
jgi:hypothetical protein